VGVGVFIFFFLLDVVFRSLFVFWDGGLSFSEGKASPFSFAGASIGVPFLPD